MERVVLSSSFRLTNEGSEYSLYFNGGNTRIYKEKDPQVIGLEEEVRVCLVTLFGLHYLSVSPLLLLRMPQLFSS